MLELVTATINEVHAEFGAHALLTSTATLDDAEAMVVSMISAQSVATMSGATNALRHAKHFLGTIRDFTTFPSSRVHFTRDETTSPSHQRWHNYDNDVQCVVIVQVFRRLDEEFLNCWTAACRREEFVGY